MQSPDARPRTLALKLEGVRRSFRVGLGFKSKAALRDVDLTLEAGASLGLVGPNGSGKSTLLRILAGVDRASGGRIEVLGGSPASRAVRARLAYLPEDSPFPGELSALSVMDLFGSLAGMPRRLIKERALVLLAKVGLEGHARTPLRRYSRGMLRRFGLAQTFLTEPELVLLDEPTAGLDATGFGALDDLTREARARGATLVLASHILSDVHAHCDRLAILAGGRVAGLGTPGELLGAEGRTLIEVEGLDAECLERLKQWLAGQGATFLEARPGGRSLLELYRAYARAGERGEGGG